LLPYNRIQEQQTGSRCIQNQIHIFFKTLTTIQNKYTLSNMDPTKQYFLPLYSHQNTFPSFDVSNFFFLASVIYDTLLIDWSKEKIESYLPHTTRLAPKLETIWDKSWDKS
jgi:hypothetical protein